jgi:hypothetical protein
MQAGRCRAPKDTLISIEGALRTKPQFIFRAHLDLA